MKSIRTGWLLATAGAGALCAGAFVFTQAARDQPAAAAKVQPTPAVTQSTPPPRPTTLPSSGTYTSPEREKFDALAPGDKETVAAFFTDTPGPLDNYLLKLEGMVALGNARYGTPNREGWQEALPVARVLEQGMCDCAQRNWLNQFIALGEAGLGNDLDEYHRQGETMVHIGRHNGDPVVMQ